MAVLGSGLDREKLPELSQMLTPVTAQYFTMEYQSGSAIWKEKIHVHIEKELQNLQKFIRRHRIRSEFWNCLRGTDSWQTKQIMQKSTIGNC